MKSFVSLKSSYNLDCEAEFALYAKTIFSPLWRQLIDPTVRRISKSIIALSTMTWGGGAGGGGETRKIKIVFPLIDGSQIAVQKDMVLLL